MIVNNESETKEFARSVASKKYKIITLSGDVGSGKTFFARELIRFFCGQEINVTSPTFNLLQIYNYNNLDIYHFDLYRIKYLYEIYELGIEDAFNNICIIEWPDIIKEILPSKSIINIKLSVIDENKRLINVTYK